MSAGSVLGQVGLVTGSILGQVHCVHSEVGGGGCHLLRTAVKECWLSSLPKKGCRMGLKGAGFSG